MGNDGGNIPTRFDLVKTRGQKQRLNAKEVRKSAALTCSLTKAKLAAPVCICRKGFFFNKMDLLKAIVNKDLQSRFSHVKSLKDIKDIPLLEDSKEGGNARLICPINQKEFNGINGFIFFWRCGCLISESAIRKLDLNIEKPFSCPNCGSELQPDDVIRIAREEDIIEEALTKRTKDEFEMSKKPKSEKAIVTPGYFMNNLIDKIAENSIYKKEINSLFHKGKKEDSRRDIFFQNCRHGTR